MRKLIAVLLLVITPAVFAGEKARKASKTKDKHYDAIAVQASSVAGNYRGPAESYGLVLEAGANGALRGTYIEMGHVAVLNAITVKGSAFTAQASFDDGRARTITGEFANRVLNGSSAFGIRMHAIPVEGFDEIDTFFERF